jgi:hypothetical protein
VTLKAFIFLLVVTIVAVVGAAMIAEALVAPGLERGILIAVISGLVVFPAARWAEYRGWIKGDWSPGGPLREQQEARLKREALSQQQAEAAAQDGSDAPDAAAPGGASHPNSAGGDPSRVAGPPSPGDLR